MFTISLFIIIIIIHVDWMNVLRIYYTTEHFYNLEQLIMNKETVIYAWMCNQYRNS